jgi:hypothetical protein
LSALSLCVLANSGVARAEGEDPAAVEKVTKLNKKAVDEYQNLNFEQARKLLRDAVDACAQTGLENHPVTARTYIHLGIVTFTGFKQRDEAIKYFRKALDIQADIKLDKILATPEVQEVFDDAVSQQKEAATKQPVEKKTGEVEHEPVTKSPQGNPITIKATVDPAMGAKKVVLSFSADGADDFAEKEMKEDPAGSGFYSAEIPSSATQGGVVDYFIEALGDDDKPIATKGSQNQTIKVAMLGADGQPVNPALRKGAKKPDKKPEKPTDENPTWFVALGIGSGVGWTTGKGEINATGDSVNPAGFEMARLLHFAPEVGYYFSPQLLLSVQMRLQLVSGATPYYSANKSDCGGDGICSPGTYALAGFARATYFFGEGDFRTYVAGNLGGGTIRHVATFKSQPVCGMSGTETCVDTVPSGPIFVGGGAGVAYNLTPVFVLTAGTNALLGFTKFTFNVDLNLGVALEF